MKKQILALIALTVLTASASYASAKNNEEKAKGYTVRSLIDGRQSTTAYDKKGNWIYTIQTYSNDNLDKSIVDKVREHYADFGVTGIQKIEQAGFDPVYIVYLENKTSLKTVRLANDDVEVLNEFKKAD